MVLIHLQQIENADNLIVSATQIAVTLGKKLGVLIYVLDNQTEFQLSTALQQKLNLLGLNVDHVFFQAESTLSLLEICETNEVSFLFVQQVENSRKHIQQSLNACRELRIPYLIFKNNFSVIDLSKIIVPVNFLIEEIEKAQFAAAFGRYCGSEILLLQAKDYGSKAQSNVAKISKVLDSFDLNYSVEQGKKDSFKIEYDAIQRSSMHEFGLIIISSSREYGLDDVVFGPKELHLLKKTNVPLMLINPRADLYVLCD